MSATATSSSTSAIDLMGLSGTPQTKRKFSFSIALNSSNLLGGTTGTDGPAAGISSARRRLSNVSDVVSRKLSHTIGWKTASVPAPEIITQGKCLCGQYIRGRLKRAGIYNKKLGLHRMRSFIGTSSIHVVREVYPALNCVGEELERMHPKLYSSISRQVLSKSGSNSSGGSGTNGSCGGSSGGGGGCSGELQSPENAAVLLSAIARELFRVDITWGKVVSLFAITGGLAVDCVRQGHPDYIPKLIEGIADVIEDELVAWIIENGGWTGLNVHVRPESTEFSHIECAAMCVAGLFGMLILFYILKFIGLQLIPRLLFS